MQNDMLSPNKIFVLNFELDIWQQNVNSMWIHDRNAAVSVPFTFQTEFKTVMVIPSWSIPSRSNAICFRVESLWQEQFE